MGEKATKLAISLLSSIYEESTLSEKGLFLKSQFYNLTHCSLLIFWEKALSHATFINNGSIGFSQ